MDDVLTSKLTTEGKRKGMKNWKEAADGDRTHDLIHTKDVLCH